MQMQRLTLLALLVRGAEASELSCRPDGVTDTSLTFKGKTMSVNNLGGLGVGCQGYLCSTSISQCKCDTWTTGASAEDPPIMRFDGVGRAGTHTAAPGASFDLVVTNLTEYMPWTYQWTGLSGSFGSIGCLTFSALLDSRSFISFLTSGPGIRRFNRRSASSFP